MTWRPRRSSRAAQLAALLAAEEGADPARASFLALWHDTQETSTGDLPHTLHDYATKPDPRGRAPVSAHLARALTSGKEPRAGGGWSPPPSYPRDQRMCDVAAIYGRDVTQASIISAEESAQSDD